MIFFPYCSPLDFYSGADTSLVWILNSLYEPHLKHSGSLHPKTTKHVLTSLGHVLLHIFTLSHIPQCVNNINRPCYKSPCRPGLPYNANSSCAFIGQSDRDVWHLNMWQIQEQMACFLLESLSCLIRCVCLTSSTSRELSTWAPNPANEVYT